MIKQIVKWSKIKIKENQLIKDFMDHNFCYKLVVVA